MAGVGKASVAHAGIGEKRFPGLPVPGRVDWTAGLGGESPAAPRMQPARRWAGPPVRASGLPLPALLLAVSFETVAHLWGDNYGVGGGLRAVRGDDVLRRVAAGPGRGTGPSRTGAGSAPVRDGGRVDRSVRRRLRFVLRRGRRAIRETQWLLKRLLKWLLQTHASIVYAKRETLKGPPTFAHLKSGPGRI